jgi:hypothetical protein
VVLLYDAYDGVINRNEAGVVKQCSLAAGLVRHEVTRTRLGRAIGRDKSRAGAP